MFIKQKDSDLQTQRKLQKAGKALGFSKNQAVTAETVRKTYSELVKALHPDSSPIVGVQFHGLDDLRKAKDFLLKHMGDA